MTLNYADAVRHLERADPALARVIAAVGPCRHEIRSEGTHFDAIIRAIVYQQLSGKAASTILGRFKELYGGRMPTPPELLSTPDETLRRAGLSRQKIGYLRDLAAKVSAGEVPIETLHELEDDAIIDALIRVKGVGRWTAHMFLMFRLGRPNVIPELDLGIQKAVQRVYRLRKLPKPARVAEIGARWSPFATVACWYLWRTLDEEQGKPRKRPGGSPGKRPGKSRRKPGARTR